MALDTKAIKQQIKSVGNIRKVTKTMEMISIAKMRKAVERRRNSEVYAKSALGILAKVASHYDIRHPLFDKRSSGKNLLVVIASDKGLCGPYNMRIEKEVAKFVADNKEETDIIAIGNKAKKIAKKLNLNVIYSQSAFPDSVHGDDVIEMILKVKELFTKDRQYKKASFVYTEFISSLEFKVVTRNLLPLSKNLLNELFDGEIQSEEKKGFTPYLFEPNEEQILEEVLPILLQVGAFQFILESLASEHSSRMLAMRNASDNAARVKDELTGEYNRARQAGITKEIIEIINAAQAI
ncbi:ATP synthase F1 subunit gamma [Candidatus Nomurabacteria bacterium]|nr:ATP synthase F1 subunit gamma [Candidatus Nomurabacteria bacterium]